MLVLVLVIPMFVVAFPAACSATEAGLGQYWPGYRNFMTGVVPSKPGLYVRNDMVGYTATAPRVVLNGLPVEHVEADAAVDIIQGLYVLPRKLFGADHAFVLTQTYGWASLSGHVIGTSLLPSDDRAAPGDMTISPLLLGWHRCNLHYNANVAIFVPVGGFRVNRVVNIGRNYWMLDPEFGITYYNPQTGWEFSGALGYSINFENSATNYKSGNAVHLDYAIGRTLRNGLKPGIVGYAWVQVTPDTGSGAIFGSFESRIFGIGPGLQWQVPKGPEFTFRYYHEFGAKNHLEGDQFALTMRMAF